MLLKHLLMSCFVVGALVTTVSAATTDITDVKPMRVGPVSIYGALGTSGKNIVSIADPSKKVILRGMSLYWSDASGISYYTEDALNWAVNNLKIDVVRYAMGVHYYKENSEAMDDNYSYYGTPSYQITYIDRMVRAAIENDIYIIIDWHSHNASSESSLAQSFFATMAEKYKDIPNVIFEVYNEPVSDSWATIKSYAEGVLSQIRTYTNNLVIVGTRNYSQNPGEAAQNPITSYSNIAYVLHFYAASHSVSSFSSTISTALNAGYPVFVSEWGTTIYDGQSGASSSASTEWTSYMDQNLISSCNWSFREGESNSVDGSSYFLSSSALTSQTAMDAATLTTSGSIVKNYLVGSARSWDDSLTAGARSGSCAFDHQSVGSDEGTISGVLVSGCTYTSSDPSVAYQSGTDIIVVAGGYAVFTANDNTETVVTVTAKPLQTFSFNDLTCYKNKTCLNTNKLSNYTGATSDTMEWKLSRVTTTEGAAITYTVADPSIVSVIPYTTSAGISQACYRFTGTIGSTTVTATAPAVTGYSAVDTTVTVSYLKNVQKLSSVFKDDSVALGSTTDMLPDTGLYDQAAVTYTISNLLAATQVGTYLVAGLLNSTITITANVAETEDYQSLERSIEVVIGSGSTGIINVSSLYTPFRLEAIPNGVLLKLGKEGPVSMQFFDASGKSVKVLRETFSAGEHWISLESMPAGSYFVRVQQGSAVRGFHWVRK